MKKLDYIRCGDYLLPELMLEKETVTYGKYGMLRRTFLQENERGLYQSLLLTGKLAEHLQQIDKQTSERVEWLVQQMKERQGIIEEMKALNQMAWIGMMNGIYSAAEEVVLEELVYA